MSKNKQEDKQGPIPPQIRERATLDFSLEELYYLVGSLKGMIEGLHQLETNAHKIKAEEYMTLMKRIDFEFTRLHIEQKGDVNKFQYTEGHWSLAQ